MLLAHYENNLNDVDGLVEFDTLPDVIEYNDLEKLKAK